MLLLALQGSKPVKVQVEDQEMFYGELKDIVSPGVGASFSFGLGLAGVVLLTWQQSLRQSSELEKQLSNLQKVVSEKDSQIQALKLSPSSPMLSQLRWFLDEDESKVQAAISSANASSGKQATPPVSTKNGDETTFSQAITKPLVITSTEHDSQPITISQLTAQTATSTLGFTQRYRNRADT
ncbi:MAG: hypothetical protein HC862_17510 [Scytonema sp. RU_4_4]|nr:hypothetical protein [Scytonema sp. RU_4_4]NJR74057.1 hypothetical protein [Scytonema sp. CRU_2_7]